MILRWLWPSLAALIDDLCKAHDVYYHNKIQPRYVGDLLFMDGVMERLQGAWGWGRFRSWLVAFPIYISLQLFGGWLFYDYNEKLKKWLHL